MNLKNKRRKKLFEDWDGFNYYDNEYIFNFKNLNHNNPKYPTIDHKTSVLSGFQNNMTPEELSSIDNLCITKRSINSKKNKMNEAEFKNQNKSL